MDRIVVREAIRLGRRRTGFVGRLFSPPSEIEVGPPGHGGTEATAVSSRVDLRIAYEALPVAQRAVVALHLYAGYSVEETANLIGVPVEDRPLTPALGSGETPCAASGGRPVTEQSNHERFDVLVQEFLHERAESAVLAAASADEMAARVGPIVKRRWVGYAMHLFGRAKVRPQTMTVAFAVAIVIVIGAGMLLLRGSDEGVGSPTNAPSATPARSSPAAAPAGVPETLRSRWMSGPRSVAGLAASSGTEINFTESTFSFAQANHVDDPLMVMRASSTGDGQLQLTNSSGCTSGDIGEYRWSLAQNGGRLTITPVSDPCVDRLAALSGEWYRVACKDPRQPCLGDLAAGTYPSQLIAPRLETGTPWTTPDYAAVTYSVPEGWANASDWAATLTLVPSTDYASYGPDGPQPGTFHELAVVADPVLTEHDADCKDEAVTPIDDSVQGFIDWLQAQPSIVTSEPTAISVGGRPGKWIDVKIAPTWKGACPDVKVGMPAIAMNLVPGTAPAAPIGLVGAEQRRLVFVDIGQGDVVLIWVDSTDPARFDQLASDSMPIIESMTFK